MHSEDWSDWADTHVNLIVPWEPSHFVGFVMRGFKYGKKPFKSAGRLDYLQTYWRIGSVTRASGCVREVVGSIPGRVIPKTLKSHKLLFRLRSALWKRNWLVRCQYNVTGWNFTSSITKTRLFKYISPPKKLKIFRYKNSDIFHISAQNIDCGYSLEPPRRGGSNEYPQSMF